MLEYMALGIIQGLTEFFPVSSSAHLVMMQNILKVREPAVAVSVILHLGTVLALIIFFWKDILSLLKDRKTLLYITVVTLITGIIGISGKDFFEKLFEAPKFAATALIFTGILLIFTKKFMSARRSNINIKDAFILGITQAVAIIPGISRSGITISTLLFRGIDRQAAFRFSFLASIPAILGAAALEARQVNHSLSADFKNLSIGFVFSFITGIFALFILRKILQKAKLHYFGYYCIFAAIITLVFL